MSDLHSPKLARLARASSAVRSRLRLQRALTALPLVLAPALGLAAGVIATRKLWPDVLTESYARRGLALIVVGVVVAVAAALLRRLPPHVGALRLDKAHGLDGRLTNALAFAELPASDRSPLMDAAIDDACERAGDLRPALAAPLSLPRQLWGSALLGAGVVALAMLHIERPEVVILVPPVAQGIEMSPDDLDALRAAARELDKKEQTPEVRAAVDKFNRLIEDIANRRLDREEAFRQMEAIERELMKGQAADAKALEEALKETARDLKQSELSKPVGEALGKSDLEQAKKELRELSKRLRDAKKPDKAALERLRKALAQAAARRKEALSALQQKREELDQDLLKKKQAQKDGQRDEQEEQLLKKKERELERLDRQLDEQKKLSRQLDRLDRELAKAAEDLMRDLGLSADDLEQAAEDLNRMQDQQMSEKEKEELRQRIEELREMLRQQGQGGQQRMARMKRFGQRARGGSGQQGQGQKSPGKQGQQGEEGDEGDQGEGKGQGQDGQGKELVLGPGGQKIMMPGMGQGPGNQPGGGSQPGGGNQPGGGKQPGTSHDANLKGDATHAKMGTQDVQAQGIDSQQGPSNSEVIHGAAEKGFRGGAYEKVYTDYHTIAEQQVDKEAIPDGYRFYVKRYFQLIRPRE